MKKRGQTSIEFLIFVGIASLVFLIFTVIAFYYLDITYSQQQNIEAQDLARTIKNEINSAAWVQPNYERVFTLPETIGGQTYSFRIGGREVIIKVESYEYVEPIATVVYAGDTICKSTPPCEYDPGVYKIVKKDDNKIKIFKQ